jgi:hypothetical protein
MTTEHERNAGGERAQTPGLGPEMFTAVAAARRKAASHR